MMYREGIQFPTKDAGLREDVHALGALIGEILRDQGGEEFFEPVEGDRVAAIARREAPAMPVPQQPSRARTAGREPRRRMRSNACLLHLVSGGQHRREGAPRPAPAAVP